MDIGFIFWLLMLLWIIFAIFLHWPSPAGQPRPLGPWAPWGYTLFTFILFFLLGWKVFGFIIRG